MSNAVAVRPSSLKRWVTWHPLLFAGYPVLFLWSQNLGEAAARDVLPVLAVVVGVAGAAVAVLALPFRDARRAALIVSPLVLGLLMFGHVTNIVGGGTLKTLAQLGAWAALGVVGLIAAIRLSEGRLARVDRTLNAIAGVLVLVTLVLIVPSQARVLAGPQVAPAAATVAARTSDRPLRDVYFLILDRYGSDRSLELRYGIKNDMTAWLGDHGFRVLPDSHANYLRTGLSLASTLNMTHLDGLATQLGTDNPDHGPIFAMVKDFAAARQFKALGYQYVHIGSYWQQTQSDPSADRDLYPGGPSDFAATLYDSSALSPVFRRLKIGGKSLAERHYEGKRFSFEALDAVGDEPGPKFVFAHILLPHPLYVFTRDGAFRDPSAAKGLPERERFGDQLAWTNDQLRAWIERLQALPEEERPIIILQADEGPYPRPFERQKETFDWSAASDDELEIKYGILNAWYLPDGTDPGLDDAMTSVNTFPTLFSGYFGLPTPRLEDRIFTSPVTRPYDFTDVTERLGGDTP